MACLLKNAGTYVRLLLVLQTLFFTSFMTAQNNPKPTLEDLIPGGATYRYPENIYGVQWKGDLCVLPDIENLRICIMGVLENLSNVYLNTLYMLL